MIYVCGTNFLGTYRHPHSEIVMQRDLVLALNAMGRPATALWSGPEGMAWGVPHANLQTVRPEPSDIMFAIHGWNGATFATSPAWEHLRVMRRRTLYASVAILESRGPGVMAAWAAFYQHIFLECAAQVPLVQEAMPHLPVEHCQLGCTLDVDLTVPSPYPTTGKHLFFAGRIGRQAIPRIQRLLEQLPPDYHLWCACPVIEFPPTVDLPWKGYAGAILKPDEEAPVPLADGVHVQMGGTAAIEVMSKIISQDPRFHAMGALPFGTFWHYHHHAFASLDFGFSRANTLAANNCKLLDMVRSGARIAAEGWSPTHYLIDKYQAGGTVEYDDTAGLVSLLTGWGAESPALRRTRGTQAALGESWIARMPQLLAAIDAL